MDDTDVYVFDPRVLPLKCSPYVISIKRILFLNNN